MGIWGYLHRVPAEKFSELLGNPKQIKYDFYSADEIERCPKGMLLYLG